MLPDIALQIDDHYYEHALIQNVAIDLCVSLIFLVLECESELLNIRVLTLLSSNQ